jgi:Cu+-exporting ATPase
MVLADNPTRLAASEIAIMALDLPVTGIFKVPINTYFFLYFQCDKEAHMSQTYLLQNVSCAGCVRKIENKLSETPHVDHAEINFPQRKLFVDGDISESELISTIESLGYGATPSISEAEDRKRQQTEAATLIKRRSWQAAITFAAGALLMLVGVFTDLMQVNTQTQQIAWGGVGIATLVLMVLGGSHFYKGAYRSAKAGTSSMDTLIALGTGVAWVFSMLVVIAPEFFPAAARHLYFEACVMILGFVNLGQVLELKSRSRSSGAIEKLMNLQPKTVEVIRENQSITIPLERVRKGDQIRIKPGEQIPIDGVIMNGKSFINESMITGESVPVQKANGDTVIGGTLNQNGSFLMSATHVGDDTAISRIIKLIRSAQNSKPHIAKLADQVTAIFVPTVIGISLLTAALWWIFGPTPAWGYMLVTSVAVLIIACPCALGLATPMSVMVGIEKAADYGVLIKNAQALENARSISAVLLDKTGTITEGQPELVRIHSDKGENEVLAIAASLEQYSEHPIARAIVDAAKERTIEIAEAQAFEAVTASGVKATIEGKWHFLGTPDWVMGCSKASELPNSVMSESKPYLLLANEDEVLGGFVVEDPVKSDSKSAIQKLKDQNIHVVMLTGDQEATAHLIGQEVGIDDIRSGLKPEDKANIVKEYQGKGYTVGFVGDGINDAPALAQADVGFAMGKGTDIAIESADVALLRSSLSSVYDSMQLSDKIVRNIKQNLFGAFAYNTLSIPVAAGILYSVTGWMLNPMIAAAAMALSSITVVSNANRLRLLKLS